MFLRKWRARWARLLGFRPLVVASTCLVSVACVGRTQYEEVRSAAEVKSEEHRRAEMEILQLKQSLSALQSELRARDSSITQKEDRLAQADLDLEVATQKEVAKGQLVDRLRNELARAGDHLKAFAEQKAELGKQLAEMQGRADKVERTQAEIARTLAVVRDLSLLMGPDLTSGEVELDAEDGQIVVSGRAASLVSSDGKRLESAGQRLAASLAKLAALHEDIDFALGDTGEGDANVESLRLLSEAIGAGGVSSERVSMEARPASSEAGADADLVIRIEFSESEAKASETEADLGGPAAG